MNETPTTHKTVMRRRNVPTNSVLEQSTFYGLFGLLMFGPLAFGAVEAWAIFILEFGTGLLFVLWLLRQASSPEIHITWNPLFAPMVVFAALVLLQVLSGHSDYKYETWRLFWLYCAYGGLCFLAVQLLRTKVQLRLLAAVFCIYGFVISVFALVQSLSSGNKLYWVRSIRLGAIYGPYVNHNHYAGLMEMLVPIPLVLSLTRFSYGTRKKIAISAAAVMASTIFLSGSRGGMVAFVVQIGVLAVVLMRQQKRRTFTMGLGFFLVLMVTLLIWLGGATLKERLASVNTGTSREVAIGTRLDIDRDVVKKMLPQRPILGFGLGVFPTVYPQYRSFYTNLFINEAHNDYLQLLAEMGIAGFITMLWFVVTMYYYAAKKMRDWANDPNGALALTAMLGCTGILVHSFVDFNLQIPANAALFYVLCLLSALDARFSRERPLRLARHEIITT